MNKFIFSIIFIVGTAQIMSQNINDALRYSNNNVEGSARFSSMSGAFGALGGDLSAISINPAGSAVYNKGVVSLSFSNTNLKNETDLQNNINNNVMQSDISKKSNFNLNQLGAVFVFNNIEKKSKWKKMSISLNYEQTKNNFNRFNTSGINSNGIDSYFLSYANGLALDEISAFEGETITQAYADIGSIYGYANQQAFLGYESFIIEPEDIDNPDNNSYYSNVVNTNSPGYYQDYYFKSRGYNGKLTANIAFQYTEKLYFGVNLNSHFIDYDQSTYLAESNGIPSDFLGTSINEIGFENNLSVLGEGFSAQIGAIAKLNDFLRIGLTYDSPTWYTITEETSQYLGTTRTEAGEFDIVEGIEQILNPNVINVFQDYKLQTPSKMTGSGALIFKKLGLLSFDYSIKDYSSIKFKPSNDPHFIEQNNIMSTSLDKSISYRIGAEILQNRVSYRAGYKFEESPRGITNHDLRGFSLGLGYKINNSRIDLSFEKFSLKNTHQMYDAGFLGDINLDNNSSIIKLTVVSVL
ncbi:transporter [Flavobacteriaceae bacterium]|nr:transporter [Flavobacteriaceae bacterium]